MRTVASFAAVLAATAALASAPAASARPTDPIVMTATGGTQQGIVVSSTETARSGAHTCSVSMTTARTTRPSPVAHDGSALTWRVPGRARPASVDLSLTRYPLPDVQVGGEESTVRVTIKPETARGRGVVAWILTSPAVGRGDIDLRLALTWKGACGNDAVTRAYRVQNFGTPL
jgi:hypothetical protein